MLLEAFKQPRSNQLTVASAATAIQSNAQKTSNESLIAIKNKAIASTPAAITAAAADKCVSTDSIDSLRRINAKNTLILTMKTTPNNGDDDGGGGSNRSSSSCYEKDETKHNRGETYVTPTNNNNGNMSVEDEINRSNVSFDDLDLRCMCSDDEEDCHHYTETGFETILVKQCSDLHLDNKLKSASSNKKNYESCDNLYSNNKRSSSSNYYRHHHRDDVLAKVSDDTTKRESKNYYHLGYNPHHKHYRKQHQQPPPPYECKLDSEVVAKKLLKSLKCEESPTTIIKLDEPPPVPPRKSLPYNNNTQSSSSAAVATTTTTSKNVNILSVSNLTSTKQQITNVSDDQNNESNVKTEDSGNDSTTSTGTAGDGASVRTSSIKSQKRKKSPEKRLVLDLNDRSKYTEEVSV